MAASTPLPSIIETESLSEEQEEQAATQTEQSVVEPPKGLKMAHRILTSSYKQRRRGVNLLNARGGQQTPSAKRQRSRTNSGSSTEGNDIQPLDSEETSWQDIMDSRIREAMTPAYLEIDEMREEMKDLKEENKKLSDRCIKIDSQSRKRNLKIWGLLEAKRETKFDLKQQVVSLLGEYDIIINHRDIDSVFRIGAKDDRVTRCTLVHFIHMADKEQTLSMGRQMYMDYQVRLDDDYPAEIEEHRRDLKPVLHAAKRSRDETGKPKYRANLHADRLIINGKQYTVDNTHRLPNELKLENVSTKQKDGITAFFTKHSPLSNHHQAEQEIEGAKYTSNEQYYMQQKAYTFGDPTTAEKIMREADPKIQKGMCKKYDKLDQTAWNNKKLDTMRTGLRAKFTQNPHLTNFLIKTGTTNILECNRADKFWGIGMAMNNPDIWVRNSWTGKAKNHLGRLLMDLRTELKRNDENTTK